MTKLRVKADGSFRGSFITRHKATGTTKVVGDGCNSGVDDWTMLLEA